MQGQPDNTEYQTGPRTKKKETVQTKLVKLLRENVTNVCEPQESSQYIDSVWRLDQVEIRGLVSNHSELGGGNE